METSTVNTNRYKRYYQHLEPLFKERKTQAYMMVVLSLFTISFFGVFAIRPTLKTIATLQKQIVDHTYLDQKLDEKINSLIQAQESYRQIETQLPTIYELLPEKVEFPSLVRKLENLAADNQTSITGLQFDPIVLYGGSGSATKTEVKNVAASTPSTAPVLFGITFNGDYLQLTSLINQLISIDRLITLDTASFGSGQAGTRSATLGLNIRSRAHYIPINL